MLACCGVRGGRAAAATAARRAEKVEEEEEEEEIGGMRAEGVAEAASGDEQKTAQKLTAGASAATAIEPVSA